MINGLKVVYAKSDVRLRNDDRVGQNKKQDGRKYIYIFFFFFLCPVLQADEKYYLHAARVLIL